MNNDNKRHQRIVKFDSPPLGPIFIVSLIIVDDCFKFKTFVNLIGEFNWDVNSVAGDEGGGKARRDETTQDKGWDGKEGEMRGNGRVSTTG